MNNIGNKLLSLIGSGSTEAAKPKQPDSKVLKENSKPETKKVEPVPNYAGKDNSGKMLLSALGGGRPKGADPAKGKQETATATAKDSSKNKTMSEALAGNAGKNVEVGNAPKDNAPIVQAHTSSTPGPPAAPANVVKETEKDASSKPKEKDKAPANKDKDSEVKGGINNPTTTATTVAAASSSSKPGVYTLKRMRVIGHEVIGSLSADSCPAPIKTYIEHFKNDRRVQRPLPPGTGRAPVKKAQEKEKKSVNGGAASSGPGGPAGDKNGASKGWDRGNATPAIDNKNKAPSKAQGGWDSGSIDSGKLAEKQRLAFEEERRQILAERHGAPADKAQGGAQGASSVQATKTGTYHMESDDIMAQLMGESQSISVIDNSTGERKVVVREAHEVAASANIANNNGGFGSDASGAAGLDTFLRSRLDAPASSSIMSGLSMGMGMGLGGPVDGPLDGNLEGDSSMEGGDGGFFDFGTMDMDLDNILGGLGGNDEGPGGGDGGDMGMSSMSGMGDMNMGMGMSDVGIGGRSEEQQTYGPPANANANHSANNALPLAPPSPLGNRVDVKAMFAKAKSEAGSQSTNTNMNTIMNTAGAENINVPSQPQQTIQGEKVHSARAFDVMALYEENKEKDGGGSPSSNKQAGAQGESGSDGSSAASKGVDADKSPSKGAFAFHGGGAPTNKAATKKKPGMSAASKMQLLKLQQAQGSKKKAASAAGAAGESKGSKAVVAVPATTVRKLDMNALFKKKA